MQRRDLFFGGEERYPCNLSGVQLARQFIKINSFICLTYHLSGNLKIRQKFSQKTYSNQKFWHLCYIHSYPSAVTILNAQKMKFFIKNFFSKYDQVCRKLRIWSHLLKEFLIENFIFCAVPLKKG